MSTVQSAIDTGDAVSLRQLVSDHPELADALIHWGPGGKNASCPLHYIGHAQDDGRIGGATAAALGDVLIAAGSDINFRQPSGDTPLIAAASLWAPELGERLVAAGADIQAQGLFGATALHWAAHLGLPTLTMVLIAAGADIKLKDRRYGSSPLGWAVHARAHKMFPGRGDQLACVRLLRDAGARIEARWLSDPIVRADPALIAELEAAPN